jgi:hypothetical protein
MMRVLAIVLVIAGSCALCGLLLVGGWAVWSALTGTGWPDGLPQPVWLLLPGIAGSAMLFAGRKLLNLADSR